MAKHRKTRRTVIRDPYAAQAQQEAGLRYAPQTQQLQSTLEGLGVSRDRAIQGGLMAALGISNAAQVGRANAIKDYGGAAYQQLGSQNFTRDQLAQLTGNPSVDVIKAGAESEAQGARERLRTTALGAMDELSARQGRGAEAANFSIQKALASYGGDASKVAQQLENVAGQSGAFAAQRESQLSEDAKKLAATLRGQTLTARTSRANARRTAATTRRGQDITAATSAAGRATTQRGQDIAHADRVAARKAGGAGGRKPLTPDQTAARVSAIRKAQSEASNLIKQGGASKAQAGKALTQGYTVPSRDRKTGLSTSRKVSPIPGALAQAGIELATQGKIGAGTARRLLKEHGLHVRGVLPTMSRSETRRSRARRGKGSPAAAVSTAGRNIAKALSF